MILTQKIRKPLIIFLCSILVFVILILVFASPITKSLIQKYDEKYTGREISVGWVYSNPFTGYVYLSDLKIHELNSDSVFLSANSLSLNFSMLKLLTGTYEISECKLDHPRASILQNKDDLNFTDLIKLFSPKTIKDTLTPPSHFSILKIKINEGEFYYHDPLIPVNYFIKNVNLESAGKRWDSDTINVRFSFNSGIGSGNMKGTFTINSKTLDYHYKVDVQKFDLNLLAQYMKDLSNYGNFSANLDANLISKGNFKDAEDVNIKGMLQLNNFHFGKNPEEDYTSFDKLVLAINELSPKNHKYLFDSVLLSQPFIKYEIYDSLDNYQRVFGKSGSKLESSTTLHAKFNLIVEIARYVKTLAKNFFNSYYQVNRLSIQNGDFRFNDYSMNEKFSVDLNPFSAMADSIDKNHDKVYLSIHAGIKPYGDAVVNLIINPKDSGTFDMDYHLQKIPAAAFNPYSIAYTSFPFDRGTIEVKGVWNVTSGIIESKNHLVIIDPRITKRETNKNTKHLPLPLLMSLIRDKGNVIDFEIPITGNLKNPKFHLHDIFTDVLENIFVKPATTLYRQEIKNIETELEKSLSLKWDLRSSKLLDSQIKFIKKMSDFLAETPGATITIVPEQYSVKEKEHILLYEAKKKYYISSNHMDIQSYDEGDSVKVDNMSTKDKLFNQYLDIHVKDSMIFTTQGKCSKIIDAAFINEKFSQLNKERESTFRSYFQDKNVDSQLKFLPAEKTIPYDGYSFYKVKYNGDYPESLVKAYRKMMEYNDKGPREKYKKERMNNSDTVQENSINK